MSKKTEKLPEEWASTLALHLSGEHVGEGWVLLDKAHPLVAMYFYHGMVQVPFKDLVPEGAKVILAFQPTKKSLKLTDWQVISKG